MIVSLTQLWLPILVGTVLAWIASMLVHMLFKYHNSDYQRIGNEDEVMDAIRKGSPGLGLHSMPYCVDMSEMKDKAMQEKFARGPVAFLTIFPSGMPNMGKLVAQQIGYFLLGCVLIAYCATLALNSGADYMSVFRFVASVGFLTFGWGTIPFAIWFGHQWSMTFRYLLDALIYGAVVAGAFAWLWPTM